MNKSICKLFLIAFVFLFTVSAQAKMPLWTFSAPNPASATVAPGSTTTVQYTVTNKSRKSKQLILKAIPGINASPCILATQGSTCILNLTVTGSKIPAEGIHQPPILCERGNSNQCYQSSQANRLSINLVSGSPILNASVTNMVLSVSGLAFPSGKSRVITITNNGDVPATGLALSYPTWPAGTQVGLASTCVNGAVLAAHGGSCTIIIEPGATATSNCTAGTVPAPGVIRVSAGNGGTVSIDALILGYGCQYQSGFLFAIDDSTTDTQSIAGTVVSLKDQADPHLTSGPQPTSIVWSSNGTLGLGFDASYDLTPASSYADFSGWYVGSYLSGLPIISQCTNLVTTNCIKGCVALIDGKCNTDDITNFYNYYITNFGNGNPPQLGATPLAYYAAGKCRPVGGISGYDDWYLPAICKLNAIGGGCPLDEQSIQENLGFLIGDPGAPVPRVSCNQPDPVNTDCFAGNYWSSTPNPGQPENQALAVIFDSGALPVKGPDFKQARYGARCVRAIT